ncbi:MAG: hypothetical protein ACRDIC_11190 [bacterium]
MRRSRSALKTFGVEDNLVSPSGHLPVGDGGEELRLFLVGQVIEYGNVGWVPRLGTSLDGQFEVGTDR